MTVKVVQTKAFGDQKPGTSGLRKRVAVFKGEHYTENFLQAILSATPDGGAANKALVVSGDGRYFVKEAVQKAIRICAGNKVAKLYVAVDGVMSTPAVSALIRSKGLDGKPKREAGKAL